MVSERVSENRIVAPQVPANGHLMTVSQAASFLGVHPNSVRRWADMGLLPAYRVGYRGDRRFRPEDVSDFLVSWEKWKRR